MILWVSDSDVVKTAAFLFTSVDCFVLIFVLNSVFLFSGVIFWDLHGQNTRSAWWYVKPPFSLPNCIACILMRVVLMSAIVILILVVVRLHCSRRTTVKNAIVSSTVNCKLVLEVDVWLASKMFCIFLAGPRVVCSLHDCSLS